MLAGQAVMVNWSNVAVEHRPAYYRWHGCEHMVGRLAIPGYRRRQEIAWLLRAYVLGIFL